MLMAIIDTGGNYCRFMILTHLPDKAYSIKLYHTDIYFIVYSYQIWLENPLGTGTQYFIHFIHGR